MVTNDAIETEEEGAAEPEAQATGRTRERSSIAFPYSDLNEAVAVARTLHEKGGRASWAQLAAWLGHDNVASGAFRLKLTASKLFALVVLQQQQAQLTALGRRIADPTNEANARAEAFLSVPLYKAIFRQYEGYVLPPSIGLQNEMVRLGVAEKSADKARQVFQRSAEQAGFFQSGRDRLVVPAGVSVGNGSHGTSSTPPRQPSEQPHRGQQNPPGGGGGENEPPALHPAIHGLLLTMPPTGSAWPIEKREKWISAFTAVLGLVYPDADD